MSRTIRLRTWKPHLTNRFVLSVAKKGRGTSSILISTMGQARMQTKRRKIVDDDEQMQMNAPMAGDHPNQMQMNGQNVDPNQSQNLYGSERKSNLLEAVDDA
jgi:hypothetical protein